MRRARGAGLLVSSFPAAGLVKRCLQAAFTHIQKEDVGFGLLKTLGNRCMPYNWQMDVFITAKMALWVNFAKSTQLS